MTLKWSKSFQSACEQTKSMQGKGAFPFENDEKERKMRQKHDQKGKPL